MYRWIVRQCKQHHPTWMRCSSLVPSNTCIPPHPYYLTMIVLLLFPKIETTLLRQSLLWNDVIVVLDTIGETKKKKVYTSQRGQDRTHISSSYIGWFNMMINDWHEWSPWSLISIPIVILIMIVIMIVSPVMMRQTMMIVLDEEESGNGGCFSFCGLQYYHHHELLWREAITEARNTNRNLFDSHDIMKTSVTNNITHEYFYKTERRSGRSCSLSSSKICLRLRSFLMQTRERRWWWPSLCDTCEETKYIKWNKNNK